MKNFGGRLFGLACLAAAMMLLAVSVTVTLQAQAAARASSPDKAAAWKAPGRVFNRFDSPYAFPDVHPDAGGKLLEIWCPPVTNSDCFILRYDGQVWMVDCSDEQWSRYAAQLLDELGIKRINKVINSHPHHDHLNGLPRIARVAEIDEVMMGFPPETNEHTAALSNFCRVMNIPITNFSDGDEVRMGDGPSVRIWMKGDRDWDLNNASAVMKLTYGDTSMLFAGDIKHKAQKRLLEKLGPEALRSDVLKCPHHGQEEMDDGFFKAVAPELVIVPSSRSAAKKADAFLKARRTDVLYTSVPCIHLISDGRKWIVEKLDFKPNPAYQSDIKVPFMKDYKKTALSGKQSKKPDGLIVRKPLKPGIKSKSARNRRQGIRLRREGA